MRNTLLKIFIISVISTALCQLGMAIICVSPDSIMHMPTLKNSILVFVAAIVIEIALSLILDYVVVYSCKTSAVLSVFCVFLGATVIQSMLQPLFSTDGEIAYRYPMLAAVTLSAVLCELLNRKIKPSFTNISLKLDFSKPETVFVGILLVFGIALAVAIPVSTTTGWDDDSHYRYSLHFSEGLYSAFDEDDIKLFYSWDESTFNDNTNSGRVFVESDKSAFSLNKVGYIGVTLGLWFGQILNLGTFGRFFCGRIGGLLLYALIVYFAIKKTPNGKLLLGLICLSPISVQYAICYSYDAWLLACTVLGFSYFYYLLLNDSKITSRDMVIMIGSIFVGTWVKMPYAVLLWILLLMPRDKFVSKKAHKIYIFIIVLCFLFELGYTFMTSFAAGDVVDSRGGEGINGAAQLIYILENPLKYVVTILAFLKTFLNPLLSSSYLSEMVYLGRTDIYIAIVLFMIITALLDNQVKMGHISLRLFGTIILFGLLVVVITSMFLVFTPVGSNSIGGVQTRYKLQLIFPFLMFVLSGWIVPKQKIRKMITYSTYGVTAVGMIVSMVSVL